MICKKCGKTIDDDSVFCEFCGAQIITVPDITNNKKALKKQKKLEKAKGTHKNIVKKILKKIIHKPSVKEIVVSSAFILVILGAVIVLLLQQNSINNLSTELSNKDSEIIRLNYSKTTLTEENNDLKTELENYKSKYANSIIDRIGYDFLVSNIAFVVDNYNSKYYHTYECLKFKNCDSYWAYNIEAARAEGYLPCPICH